MSAILELNNLSCYHHNKTLFANLDLVLKPGQLLLIEGANGSGKTSLLRAIAGLSNAYTGEIYWRNKTIHNDLMAYHSQILHIGHKFGIKLGLTVTENIKLMAALKRTSKPVEVQQILADFQLHKHQQQLAQQLSAGQRRKLALTRLCFVDTTLWLLDEPFATLDQQTIKLIQSLIIQHTQHQGMAILTTHQMVNFTDIDLIRLQL